MTLKHLVLDLTDGGVVCRSPACAVRSAIADGIIARRVAPRSATTTPCTFASFKMGECFGAESPGESDAMLLADVLEDVVSFLPQPVEIRFYDGERCRSAFPDLGVVGLNGEVDLWEVKGAIKDPVLARRLGHLSASLCSVGIGYRVLTSAWLARGSRRAITGELHRHARRPLPSAAVYAFADLVTGGQATLGSLGVKLELGRADLSAAAAQGLIAVDIDGPALGEGTPVRLPRSGARSGGYMGRGVWG